MRRLLTLSVAIAVGLSGAQNAPEFRSAKGALVMRWTDFSITQLPGNVYRFDLSGNVYAAAKDKGIEIWAPRVRVDAISTKGKEADAIKAATATGGVRAVQTVKEARSEMKGATAVYTTFQKNGKINMTGPVQITNFTGTRQSLAATGSSLVAELGDTKAKQPVRTATLKGPVHIKIRQAAKGKVEASDLVADGKTLILDFVARPATVTLLGGVHLHGTVAGGSVTGTFGRVILTLDDKNEVVKTEGRSQ